MLKFFGRTAFKYALFVRYKRSIITVALGLVVIVVAHFLYADVAEHLKASQSLECLAMTDETARVACVDSKERYRMYALLTRWAVTLLALVVMVFTVNPVSRSPRKKAAKKTKRLNAAKPESSVSQVMAKKSLQSEADKIWQTLKKKSSD